MAIIMPGIMKRSNPITSRTPKMNCAMSSGISLERVKLKLEPRLASPFSILSEAYLTAAPVATMSTIHETRPDKTPLIIRVEKKSKSHSVSSSGGALNSGCIGKGKDRFIT